VSKYIEIQVPDTFDDSAETTFAAVEQAIIIYPVSRVRQGDMFAALESIETALSENLVWLTEQLDVNAQRTDPETIRRLEQLAEGWCRLYEFIADVQGLDAAEAQRASDERRRALKRRIGGDVTCFRRGFDWLSTSIRALKHVACQRLKAHQPSQKRAK